MSEDEQHHRHQRIFFIFATNEHANAEDNVFSAKQGLEHVSAVILVS